MSRKTRPFVMLDSQGHTLNDTEHDIAFKGVYSGTNLTYVGMGRVGSDTSAGVWQIRKLTYDGSGNLTAIEWPVNSSGAASSDYEFIWDNYAAYTYV